MKIILTNDGLIGLDFDPKCDVIWCHNQEEALALMWSHFGPRQQFTKQEIASDLAYAIDHCAKVGHTLIEFGVLGSFLYTSKEDSNEF